MGLSMNVLNPLGTSRARVSFVSYVLNESLRGAGWEHIGSISCLRVS